MHSCRWHNPRGRPHGVRVRVRARARARVWSKQPQHNTPGALPCMKCDGGLGCVELGLGNETNKLRMPAMRTSGRCLQFIS